ncbi:UNVERIFIED_CONTAM: hypothetical protein FKN15_072766 [Acipenser sinensis]
MALLRDKRGVSRCDLFHFNPSQSTLVMEGDDIEYINQALRKVSYINSRQFPTPGIRRLKTSTTVQCYGEDTCISIPDVDAFVVVLQPSEPRITITGMDHFARLDTEFESSEGLVLFPNVRIISTVTKTDLPPQGKARKRGEQEEIIHNLDYCDILVIGNELNPDQESLQLNRNELHGKHLDATNSTSGISIYAIPSTATIVIVVCISSLLLIVVLGIYRVRVAHLHSSKHSCENDIMDMNNLLIKIKDSKIETHKRVGEGFLDLHKILGDFEDLLIDTMNKQAAERVERVESFISHSSKKLYPLEGLLLYCKEALKEHNQGAFLQSVNHLTSQVVSIVDELYVPEDELKEDPYKSFRLGFGNVSKDLIDLLQSNFYHDKEVERPRTPKLYINNKYQPEPPELLFQVEDTETMTKTDSTEPKQYKRVSKSPPTVPPSKVVQVKGEDSFKMVRRQEKRPRSTPPYQEDHHRMNTFHCHSGRSHDDLEALPSSRNFSVKVPDCLLPRPPIIYQHIMLEDTAKV